MLTIGYLVSADYDEHLSRAPLFRDLFALLQPACAAHDVRLEKLIWTDGDAWTRCDVLMPSGVWDYSDRPDQFVDFLAAVDANNIPMINPTGVVRWNMHKRYLHDLAAAGLPVLPMRIIPRGTPFSIADNNPYPEHAKILLKPTISGGAKHTMRYATSDLRLAQPLVDTVLAECDLIVQPFFPEVTQGEYSFFFFGQQFSHAIVKVPTAGDFRAHSFFQATNHPYAATPEEIRAAARFVAATSEPCAYARVDLITVANEFHLVELEVIEPYLYCELASDQKAAVSAFAGAITRAARRAIGESPARNRCS